VTLLPIDKFGGIVPKIIDPALLPPNRSIAAKNVRFDRGGIAPLRMDLFVLENKTTTTTIITYYPGELVTTELIVTAIVANPVIPGVSYNPWQSCPQGIFVLGGNVYFVTTDNQTPPDNVVSTLQVLKWDESVWATIYSVTVPIDLEDYMFTYIWKEPDISIHTRGTTTVLGFIRQIEGTDDDGLDIFVFNNETMVSRVQIPGSIPTYGIIRKLDYHSALIDSSNIIHVVPRTYTLGTTWHIWDFRSTDGGMTFTPINVDGGVDVGLYTGEPVIIQEDSIGNLWIHGSNVLFKSTDNGASWVVIDSTTGISSTYKGGLRTFAVLNDIFFAVTIVLNGLNYDVVIKRSTDGSIWTTVLTVSGTNMGSYLAYADLGFDGTYYYAIINFRNSSYGLVTGYNQVYRSSDGLNWTLISTFSGDEKIGVANWPSQLVIDSETLYYTYYYASTFFGGTNNVYMLSCFKSTDHGETWVAIQTPYYDLTTGGSQVPPDAETGLGEIIEANIPIDVKPSDIYGFSYGVTEFRRNYDLGIDVTLIAPESWAGEDLTAWLVDYILYTTGSTLVLSMDVNHIATAVYTSGIPILIVESENPDTGVSITVSPADIYGDTDGITIFIREYGTMDVVTLTSPLMVGDNPFQKWKVDGIDYATTEIITVTMDVIHNAAAVYYTPPEEPPTEPPPPGEGPDITDLNQDLMMNLPHVGSSFGAYSFSSQSPALEQEAYYFFQIPTGRKPTQVEFWLQTMTPGGIGDFEMWVTAPDSKIYYGDYPHTNMDRVSFRDGTARPVLVGYYLIKIIMHAGTHFMVQASFKPEEWGPYPWEFSIRLANTQAEAVAKMSSGEWLAMWSSGYPNIY